MEKQVLHASHREVTGKQVKRLRREGKLPAIMYGYNIKPTSISLDFKEATYILGMSTASSIINIELDNKENAALVREKQQDFIKGNLLHVDFQIVSLTEKLRASVSIELTGLSPAVKDFNGVVVEGLDELEVECLPQDLPERFVVDVTSLLKIGDALHVKDVQVPANVTVMDDPEEMVAIITAAKEEEVVVEAVPEEAVTEEPEVIEKGKKEEEIPGEVEKPEKGEKKEKA